MSVLLATKLHRPSPPPKRVERPRLIQALNEGLESDRKVTLVSAPAGFGKTTCICEWINDLRLPVTWLSLDPADNDPVRFLAYLIAALQKVDQAAGRDVEGIFSISSGQTPPIESLITALINDIQKIPGKFILILDDFHVIKAGPVLKAMETLLVHQPGNMHLILITREDPQLPLARLRANNQLTEVRAADLRFSSGETGRFLNEMMDLSLSAADIAALENRTEGWVVGLQLAGLSMRGRPDPSSFIANLSGSHRFILSYLTEEVLSRQPEEIQEFLLKTSILEKMCADLCDAVIENRESRTESRNSSRFSTLDSRVSILAELDRSNLFLVPLDDQGQWYRYHHLFADLLQAQLWRMPSSAEMVASLHVRASDWFARHEMITEAVNHALAAGDFDRAARLVEENTYPLMARGELDTLVQWIEALPADVTRRRPLFLVAKAWALTFAGAAGQVETALQRAEAQVNNEPETPVAREVMGNAAAIRAFFTLMTGNEVQALELAERAEALLPTITPDTSSSSPYSFAAHSLLPFTLGMAYRSQGQYEKAAEAFGSKLHLYTAPHAILIWTIAITEQAVVRRLQGRLRESVEICRRAQSRFTELGIRPTGGLTRVDAVLSDVLREQNNLDEAYRGITGTLERIHTWDMPTDRLAYLLSLVRIQESQGDFAGAVETLRKAKDLKTTQPVFWDLARTVDIYDVRLALAVRDIPRAARLLDELQPGTSRAALLRDQELILLARLLLAQGRPEDALAGLLPLAGDAEATGRTYTWLETSALQACALHDQGNREAAVTVLLNALKAAEPEGFVQVFVEQGDVMQPLLSTAGRQSMQSSDPVLGSVTAYVNRLIRAFPVSSTPAGPPPPPDKAAGLVEPFTDRELEVLRLIADGLTYGEIAARLYISVNTVRTYIKAIYGKLNVDSRAKAASLARQLKLI